MRRVATWTLTACLLGLVGCAAGTSDYEAMTDSAKRDLVNSMYDGYKRKFPDAPEITVAELVKALEKTDFLLVDVREPREMAVSVIPGAVTKTEFERNPQFAEGRTVVAYCTIGYRSGEYVETLVEKGLDARNLAGSLLSWVHAGQPVVDSEGREVKRLHTYGAEWALAPDAYENVY
ncbi:MAG: rhodanese-like domain-containing protein [bacterium]|nr:rhodanese-like domain-containing protein [bacterium]